MLNRLSINLALGLALASQACASRKQFTLNTKDLGGDSTEGSGNKPLVLHLDKNSMSAQALESLARRSNIDIASLPDFPQFLSLGEFENMKYSTDDILEELVKEKDLDLDLVKQNERYSQIEEILKEIAEEYENRDEKKECGRGPYENRNPWGEENEDRRPCDKPKEDEDQDNEKYWDEEKWSEYDDADVDEGKWLKDEDKEKDDAEKHENDEKDKKLDEKLDDKLDDKIDNKLEDKLEDRLEDKLDEKLDGKLEEKNDDTKEESKDDLEQKDDDKKFFWHFEEDETSEYDADDEDLLTIKEPQHEETFYGTEVSVGKTLVPTESIDSSSSNPTTYLTVSSKVLGTTVSYTTKYTSSEIITATSVYSTSKTSKSKTEHEVQESSSNSKHGSSVVSTKTASEKHETSTTSSKHERKTNGALLNPNWKAQSNASNVTTQGGQENSSSFLMPTSLLFAFLLASLAVLQI